MTRHVSKRHTRRCTQTLEFSKSNSESCANIFHSVDDSSFSPGTTQGTPAGVYWSLLVLIIDYKGVRQQKLLELTKVGVEVQSSRFQANSPTAPAGRYRGLEGATQTMSNGNMWDRREGCVETGCVETGSAPLSTER